LLSYISGGYFLTDKNNLFTVRWKRCTVLNMPACFGAQAVKARYLRGANLSSISKQSLKQLEVLCFQRYRHPFHPARIKPSRFTAFLTTLQTIRIIHCKKPTCFAGSGALKTAPRLSGAISVTINGRPFCGATVGKQSES
jgi:hypothetical protein